METTLHTEWTVEDICKGFTYNELEGKGLFGLDDSGEFVNAAKRVFSNSQNAEIQKWSHYIKGDAKRPKIISGY